MRILSIESSTQNLSLSVAENERVLRFRNEFLKNKLSNKVIGCIDKICRDAKSSFLEMDAIAVGLGPGSFTSLRVGLSTVKGLAFDQKKQVVGISSLDVLALNVKESQAYVSVVCDAKRQMVYFAQYQKDGKNVSRVCEYQLLPIEDLKEKNIADSIVIGDGIPLIKESFKGKGEKIQWESSSRWFPQAKHLSVLAYKRLQQKDVDDVRMLNPLYLYPQDCQVRR